MAKYVVEQGANVEASNDKLETPLFYAIYSQRVEMTRYLVSIGCLTNKTNKRGMSCRDLADKCRNKAIRDIVIQSMHEKPDSWQSK
jgi:ankyrin repeat protein